MFYVCTCNNWIFLKILYCANMLILQSFQIIMCTPEYFFFYKQYVIQIHLDLIRKTSTIFYQCCASWTSSNFYRIAVLFKPLRKIVAFDTVTTILEKYKSRTSYFMFVISYKLLFLHKFTLHLVHPLLLRKWLSVLLYRKFDIMEGRDHRKIQHKGDHISTFSCKVPYTARCHTNPNIVSYTFYVRNLMYKVPRREIQLYFQLTQIQQ